MTVIAYRDGVLAADTLEVFDDAGKTYCSKLHRITTGKHRGDIIGVSGGSFIGGLLTAWYTDPQHHDKPDMADFQDTDDADGCRALVVKRDGSVWLTNATGVLLPRHDRFFAIGHGAPFAMGAMAAGRSAREACRIACRFSEYCGLPIQTMKLPERVRK